MGDMLELGEMKAALHRRGRQAHGSGGHPDARGGRPGCTQETADGARRAGVGEVHHHLDSVRCAESLGDLLRDGDLIVVKGSRGMHMDRIVRALIFRFAGTPGQLMFFRMLYELFATRSSAFNVFQYITFRTAMAALTAFVVSFLLGPRMISSLRQLQIGQEIREEGPSSHQAKKGTPTMGGTV